MCQVLSTWCPWAAPSNKLLQAMSQLQGHDNIGSDIASMCMARAAAIQQLTYEELHGPQLPDQLRYQRGARWQLSTPNAWKRRFDRKSKVSQAYMTACAGVPSIDELDAKITQANCAKWSKPHGREYGRCVGIGFSLAPVCIIFVCFGGHCPRVPDVSTSSSCVPRVSQDIGSKATPRTLGECAQPSWAILYVVRRFLF